MKKQPYLAPDVSLLVVSTEALICASLTKNSQVNFVDGGSDEEFE